MQHPPKNVIMNTIKISEESIFLKLNFMKSPFSSYWILWKIRFSLIEFCEESIFLKLNFVKSPFFSYWILWRVRFSHIEFCEESVFLMLNFVKCPKMDSIFPLDRPLASIISYTLSFQINNPWFCKNYRILNFHWNDLTKRTPDVENEVYNESVFLKGIMNR